MAKRKVSDSVPNVKSRGMKSSSMKPIPGVLQDAVLGNPDPSDCSKGHDKGAGEAAPASSHKFPGDL